MPATECYTLAEHRARHGLSERAAASTSRGHVMQARGKLIDAAPS